MNTGIDAICSFISENPILYAGTIGLDKTPQVHPVEICFEENGALYFATAKCETFYGELSLSPDLTLCTHDRLHGITMKISGKAVFTEDEEVISRCLDSSTSLKKKWGNTPEMVIAYFLTDAIAAFINKDEDTTQIIELGTPENVLVGIRFIKDNEIRDRLIRIMTAHESNRTVIDDSSNLHLQKLYDGALLYFAEEAKKIWPRMDIGPAERSVVFETYDEREEYTGLAKKLIGNARIDKPEDLSYWLNIETLTQLKNN